MRNLAFRHRSFPAVVLGISMLVLGACATTPAEPPQALQSARNAYSQAEANPAVQRHAAVQLNEARQALQRAEEAESRDEMTHYAYLAERYAQTATQIAEQQVAQANIAKLGEERDQFRLATRERQVQQLEAELAALEAKQTDRGLVMTLGGIVFETDKAVLKPGAMDSIDRLAEFLEQHPERTVRIEGHTDSTGSPEHNLALSQQRAEAVRDELIARGISQDRIQAIGRGETTPIASNQTAAGRQLNRRVEIVIQGGEETAASP